MTTSKHCFIGYLSTLALCLLADSGLAQTPPANDNFTNALILNADPFDRQGEVTWATEELGEPTHLDGKPCKSLWWRWQAPKNASSFASDQFSSATNITIAVYTGPSIESLSLVVKALHNVNFTVVGGTTYYLAAVVPTNTIGGVRLYGGTSTILTPTVPVPGNLLNEWSFENTGLEFTFWQVVGGGIGGWVNERGGADGVTWPYLPTGVQLYQDFPTVPGRNYQLKFAHQGGLLVQWDNRDLGVSDIPAGESFWHWTNFVITASNTTSRVTFTGMGNVPLDAVSVVWMNEPPSLVRQPVSLSVVTGGTAAFVAGARGTPPLCCQWFFQNAPLTGGTNDILVLSNVSTQQAGTYFLLVTNAFGCVTSAPAVLALDAPLSPTIVLQPYGDTVALGAYCALSVAAIGTPPLAYQWYLEGLPLENATNRRLVFSAFDPTNAGTYTVKVSNLAETVWSLPATLRLAESTSGGGLVLLANWFLDGPLTNQAPVFDIDGLTKLSGSDFVAQLYAGPTLALLRAAGSPVPFQAGLNAGYIQSQTVTLPTVGPGSNACVQVRVWQPAQGASYEEARALGSRFGRSELLQVTAGGNGNPPQCLRGLASFGLQAGLPQFVAGRIDLSGQQPDGTPIWSLLGNAGYRYLIVRASADFVWRPWLVLSNLTGTVTFTDPSPPPEPAFYRARILE